MTDPRGSVELDARSLRGLAHPLRMRLLGLLRVDGPATASGLAARVGESSGLTSYHLRQLAEYGFIVEDESPRSNRRERWWRAAHRTTVLKPLPEPDAETRAMVDEFLRSVALAYSQRMLDFVDSREALAAELGDRWLAISDFSDWLLELTPDEAEELVTDLHARVQAQRQAVSGRVLGEGRERVAVLMQIIPTVTEGRQT